LSSKLKRLSGPEVVNIMHTFGFEVHSQRGSHAKLRRINPKGEKQTMTIPLHNDLDVGTLRAILRQAVRYIPETELWTHFYAE